MVSILKATAMGLSLIRAPVGRLAWSPSTTITFSSSSVFGRTSCGSRPHRRGLSTYAADAHRPSATRRQRYASLSTSTVGAHGSHMNHRRHISRLFHTDGAVSWAGKFNQNKERAPTDRAGGHSGATRAEECGGDHGGDGGVHDGKGERAKINVKLLEQLDVEIQPVLHDYFEGTGGAHDRIIRYQTRQHVNPLSHTYQTSAKMPSDWFRKAFRNPAGPLHVDIGCAKAIFLTSMATKYPDRNFLGLEIRRPIAAKALHQSRRVSSKNCLVVCSNVNVDLDALLTEASARGALIDVVSMQFPDPLFKAKKQKRRMLQPALVAQIAKHLRPGGMFFMQSDFFPIMEEMRELTRQETDLMDSRENINDWMEGPEKNPFEIQTEREAKTYEKTALNENRVYRSLFYKKTTEQR